MKTVHAVALAAACLLLVSAVRRPAFEDVDNDGRNTRQQVIEWRCQVALGLRGGILEARCLDGYTGEVIETKRAAEEIAIDHLYPWAVAAKRANFEGRKLAREAFFNDLDNLIVTSARVNSGKSDKMPGAWCPPTPLGRRSAAARMRRVVDRHGLPLLAAEEAAVVAWEAGECGP